MAELSKLLGFMSAWDRRDTLQKYEALFCETANDEELIATLGSPTKLAIGLALNYVPSPAPVSIAVEEEEEAVELAAEEEAEQPAEDVESAEGESLPEACEEEEEEPYIAEPRRRVRAFGLLVSIIFGLVIGLPIALFLICVGIPFLVSGLGVAGGAVWAALTAIPMLSMFSDILVVLGVGLVLCALGLLLAWFGLWLSFELGYLWLGGVVLRLGRALTYKKEVAAE